MLARISQGIIPDGVFSVVLGTGATGAQLVSDPRLGLVSITGSVRAGIAVAAAAAADVKRAHLELGGKAPAVVFADADVEAAASGIAEAAFFNAGQDCTAATRAIVHTSVYDRFVQAVVARRPPRSGRAASTTRTRSTARSTTSGISPPSPRRSRRCPITRRSRPAERGWATAGSTSRRPSSPV